MVLKPNMVVSGSDCPEQAGVDEVVTRTLELFGRAVPTEVPGIAFLSGGQSDERASAHLSAMNAHRRRALAAQLLLRPGAAGDAARGMGGPGGATSVPREQSFCPSRSL